MLEEALFEMLEEALIFHVMCNCVCFYTDPQELLQFLFSAFQ